MEGNVCSGPSDCTSMDINMVCRLESILSQGQASFCWLIQRAKDRFKDQIDVQLTRPSVDGNMVMVCHCRRDMRWNERALECQVLFVWCWYRGKHNFRYNIQWNTILTILFEEFHFPLFQLYLDVDCTNLTYTSEVSPGQLSNMYLAFGFVGCILCSSNYRCW